MARDQDPLTDEEIEALRDEMHEQRDEIREHLANEGVDVSAWDSEQPEARADGGQE